MTKLLPCRGGHRSHRQCRSTFQSPYMPGLSEWDFGFRSLFQLCFDVLVLVAVVRLALNPAGCHRPCGPCAFRKHSPVSVCRICPALRDYSSSLNPEDLRAARFSISSSSSHHSIAAEIRPIRRRTLNNCPSQQQGRVRVSKATRHNATL